MNRLLPTVLAALAVGTVLALAARLGGAVGGGVALGGLTGAGLSALCYLHQRHVLATHPERALHAAVLGFLVKGAVLLLGALALRFVPSVGARVDWRGFVIAYAAAVALLLPLSAWFAVRGQRQRAASAARA